MRKIALEEHFVTEALAPYGASTAGVAQPAVWAEASRRLLEVSDERLAAMDAAGIDLQVLSLNAPGIQAETDVATAIAAAADINDFLAGLVAAHPTRFAGFAALPLQDGKAAARELDRSVTELGFKGALVNAHTHGRYLDDPELRVVWEQAEGLDVPLYLHPANGFDTPHVLSGHPELVGPMWSWGPDTATHALRLVFGKVFDDFPKAKLLLGHMGEGLPFTLWRLDSRWDFNNRHGIELALGRPSEYLRRNMWITTSGVCSDGPLLCSLLALGADRILFGTDWPFESMAVHAEYLDRAPLSEHDRAKIAHRNAEALLRIPPLAD